MGYIAPIPHYQYRDYSERGNMRIKKRDPFPIYGVQNIRDGHEYVETYASKRKKQERFHYSEDGFTHETHSKGKFINEFI